MEPSAYYAAWLEEAELSIEALEAGALKALYKVAGQEEAIGIMDVTSCDDLDGIYQLPLWAKGNSHLVSDIEWVPLREHEAWVADLRGLSSAT